MRPSRRFNVALPGLSPAPEPLPTRTLLSILVAPATPAAPGSDQLPTDPSTTPTSPTSGPAGPGTLA